MQKIAIILLVLVAFATAKTRFLDVGNGATMQGMLAPLTTALGGQTVPMFATGGKVYITAAGSGLGPGVWDYETMSAISTTSSGITTYLHDKRCAVYRAGRKIYCFGGYAAAPDTPTGLFSEVDLTTSTWSIAKVSGTAPKARNDHSMAMNDEYMFIGAGSFGLTGSAKLADDGLHRFHFASSTWTTLSLSFAATNATAVGTGGFGSTISLKYEGIVDKHGNLFWPHVDWPTKSWMFHAANVTATPGVFSLYDITTNGGSVPAVGGSKFYEGQYDKATDRYWILRGNNANTGFDVITCHLAQFTCQTETMTQTGMQDFARAMAIAGSTGVTKGATYLSQEVPGRLIAIIKGFEGNTNFTMITATVDTIRKTIHMNPIYHDGRQRRSDTQLASSATKAYSLSTAAHAEFDIATRQWTLMSTNNASGAAIASERYHAVVYDNNKVHHFGGRHPTGGVLTAGYSGYLNLGANNTWVAITGTLPPARELPKMCAFGTPSGSGDRSLLVYGGRERTLTGFLYRTDAHVLAPGGNSWSQLTLSGTGPRQVLSPGFGCVGSNAYLWGGKPSGDHAIEPFSNTLFRLAIGSGTATWSSITTSGTPAATYGSAFAVVGTELWIAGGRLSTGAVSTLVSAFDTAGTSFRSLNADIGGAFTGASLNYTDLSEDNIPSFSDSSMSWYVQSLTVASISTEQAGLPTFKNIRTDTRQAVVDTAEQVAPTIAQASSGDVLNLPEGVLSSGALTLPSSTFTLKGKGAGTTVLDFGNGPGFTFNGGSPTLEALTLRNARTTTGKGAALRAVGATTVLTNVAVENCESTGDGGCVSIEQGTATFNSVTVTNGTSVSGNGGGVSANGATLSWTSGTVTNGKAARGGGGISLVSCTSTTFTDINVTMSQAQDGGGISFESGTINPASKIMLKYNTATRNGGGLNVEDAVVSMSMLTAENNTASGLGGGVAVQSGTAATASTLTSLTARYNRASSGGGFSAAFFAEYTVRASTIMGNAASTTGAGVQVADNAKVHLVDVTVNRNMAGSQGGGVFLTGGADLTMYKTSGSSGNNAVKMNQANAGAGFATSATAHMNVSDTDVEGNTALAGNGAGLLIDHKDTSRTYVMRANVRSNVASAGNGGGVFVGSSVDALTLSTVTYAQNQAVNGAGLYMQPVYNAAKLTLSGQTFSSNAASRDGGGFFFERDAPEYMCSGCSFASNSVGLYGGDNATITDALVALPFTTAEQNSTLPLSPAPLVNVVDIYGRRVTSDRSTVVSVEVVSSGITIQGVTSIVVEGGQANFAGLIVNAPAAGTYQLRFTSPGLTTSSLINVVIAACRAGTSRVNGACTPCNAGSFSNTNDATTCTSCPAGSFTSTAGLTTCRNCPAGTFNLNQGQTVCSDCSAGKYAAAPARTICLDCAFGTFAAAPGSSSCSSCGPSQYTAGAGQAVCQSCAAGTFYDPAVDPQGCQSCPNNAVALNKTCECGVGFYGTYDGNDRLTKCDPCPEGAVCTKTGLRINTMGTKPGFWRADSSNADYVRCISLEACVGSASGSTVQSGCRAGHGGPLCDQCIVGYGKSGSTCEACPEPVAVAFAMLGIFLALLVVVALLIRSTMRANAKIAAGYIVMTTPMMKLLLNYMQLTSFSSSFDLRWPPSVLALFSIFQNVSAPKLQISSLDCMFGISTQVFYSKFILFMFVPVIAIVLPAAVFLIFYQVQKAAGTASWVRTRDQFNVTVMVVLFMIHPSLTQRIFEMFNCVSLGNGQQVLAADVTIDCASDSHAGWQAAGVFFLLLYTIGIPLAGAILLYVNREKVKGGDKVMLTKYGFLYNGFERDSIKFYWEVGPLMIRKVMVLVIVVFVQPVGESARLVQALAGVFIVFAAIVTHIWYQPYEDDILDNLEAMSLTTSFATLFLGLFFYLQELSPAWIGFLSFLIVFMNIVTLVAMVLHYGHYAGFKPFTTFLNLLRRLFGFRAMRGDKTIEESLEEDRKREEEEAAKEAAKKREDDGHEAAVATMSQEDTPVKN